MRDAGLDIEAARAERERRAAEDVAAIRSAAYVLIWVATWGLLISLTALAVWVW